MEPLRRNIASLSNFVEGQDTLKSDINLMISLLENSFSGLETEHLGIKTLSENGCFVPMEEFHIADVPETVIEQGHLVIKQVEIRGHVVNTMGTIIKKFMELPGVLRSTLDNMDSLSQENVVISSILQGTLWKEHVLPKFEGQLVMPLTLFADEFEPDNCKGSHAGDNKIMAVHFHIPAIPQKFQSSFENIFVATFLLHNNLKMGIENCVYPLIEQLTQLELEGIEIMDGDNPVRIYFALVLVRGDNAGLHNILGFVESVVANHCCRICRVHRDVMRHTTVLDQTLLRTVQNYQDDVQVNNVTVTGVIVECFFNAVPNFHCVVNQYCDLMHDVPEGVLKYAMCCIIHYLVNERNYFDFDSLQSRVKNFDYGSAEIGNRPPSHKLTPERVANDSINFSASEMLCFTRFFGEMVGDLVPEGDEVWLFYLHMRDLTDVLFAPKFVVGSEIYLKHMVEYFLHSYLNLFPGHLTIQFNLLLHYMSLFTLIGPVVNLWCMIDEGKHRESRIIAHSTNSRIRLEYTLLFRHQLKLSSRLLAERRLFVEFEYGVGNLMPPNYFGLLNNAVEQLPEVEKEPFISVS